MTMSESTNQEVQNNENFQLTISADKVESTETNFTMDDLTVGDQYKFVDGYFQSAAGKIIRQTPIEGKKDKSNQTLPRIAFQLFTKNIAQLPEKEKINFPICRYKSSEEIIQGIYSSTAQFKEFTGLNPERFASVFDYGQEQQFVIYCWNIFTPILFVQECLNRFGAPGDQFILIYKKKSSKSSQAPKDSQESLAPTSRPMQYINNLSSTLLESKNIILRGAPGTGKSYLAKRIAADIITHGQHDDFEKLTDDQKEQYAFVQFHPSYDYADFVEGLRPVITDDGTMSFELRDGTFKSFVSRARKNYEDSQKSIDVVEKEISAKEAMEDFFSDLAFGTETLQTTNGNSFTIVGVDDDHIQISIPQNTIVKNLTLKLSEIRDMLESDVDFQQVKDITAFFNKKFATQAYSYDFVIYNAIKAKMKAVSHAKAKQEEEKKYIFVIDEINRGEISKIFGELFFSIDPGYRGKAGEISTQYANLHSDPREKFYIPKNVYIIGTMNDIDRSVDNFDFAMRRRFRFIEIKANEHMDMLNILDGEKRKAAKERMRKLNEEIAKTDDLNENYQIGASYFLKLREPSMSFDKLWNDYLAPLLEDYVRGMHEEKALMTRFAEAYGYPEYKEESNENQG